MASSSKTPKPTVRSEVEAPAKTPSAKASTTSTKAAPTAPRVSSTSKPTPVPRTAEPTVQARAVTKLEEIVAMLRTKQGASIDQMAKSVGWHRHSVHGLISGNIRKKQGLNVVSEMVDGVRVYRIVK